MRYPTTSGMMVVALCIGDAMAGPAHAHLHKKIHEKRSVNWSDLPWNDMGIDWAAAYAAGQHTSTVAPVPTTTAAPAPVVPTTTSAAAPVATTAASSINSIISDVESDVATLFDGLVALANDLVAFGEATLSSGTDVGKIGNIGAPQGSNCIKVSSTAGYQYTNNFINTSNAPLTVVLWNKAFSPSGSASDAQANMGAFVATKTPTLTFALAPGASQLVAFQEDTQIGWTVATSATTSAGAFDNTWGEGNFASDGCGFDVSAIVNTAGNDYDMAISAAEVSEISAANPPTNMWLTASDPVGDSNGSVYIPASFGTCTLTTKLNGIF
jgi:hypothetical protein